jgi:hypothetical protein
LFSDGVISEAIYGNKSYQAIAEEILDLEGGYFDYNDVVLRDRITSDKVIRRLIASGMIKETPRSQRSRHFVCLDSPLWDIVAQTSDSIAMIEAGRKWEQPSALPISNNEWGRIHRFYNPYGRLMFPSANRMCLLLWLAHRRNPIFHAGDAQDEISFFKNFRLLDSWVPLADAGMLQRTAWEPWLGTVERLPSPLWWVGITLRRLLAEHFE